MPRTTRPFPCTGLDRVVEECVELLRTDEELTSALDQRDAAEAAP